MKRHYFKVVLVLIAFAGLTLTSCKKSASVQDTTVSAQDLSNVTNAIHSTSDDAASAAGQVSSYKSLNGGGFSLNTSNGNFFVGATITDTSSTTGIVITYDSISECNGFIRSGTITVTNTGGKPWHEQGAQLTVTYTNVKVTDVVSGNTYTLNGSHTITNLTGGLVWQLPLNESSVNPIAHQIQSSNMTITFPNGATATWAVNRTRTWSWSSATSTLTAQVSASAGVNGNITETGTNRFGQSFTNAITSPIIGNNNCGFRPYTGTWQHVIEPSTTLNVTFGTNSSGTQIGTATGCGTYGDYGFYASYSNGSISRNRFFPYWR